MSEHEREPDIRLGDKPDWVDDPSIPPPGSFAEAFQKLGRDINDLGRAIYNEIPWHVKAFVSADEEIATSQARADRQRDEARHRHDWSPYLAILLALVAAALIVWWELS